MLAGIVDSLSVLEVATERIGVVSVGVGPVEPGTGNGGLIGLRAGSVSQRAVVVGPSIAVGGTPGTPEERTRLLVRMAGSNRRDGVIGAVSPIAIPVDPRGIHFGLKPAERVSEPGKRGLPAQSVEDRTPGARQAKVVLTVVIIAISSVLVAGGAISEEGSGVS